MSSRNPGSIRSGAICGSSGTRASKPSPRAMKTVTATLKDGPLDRSTLYLLWAPYAKFDWTIGPDDGVGVFDGYFVVAPGWFAEPRGSIAPEYLVRGPRRGIAP